ncbi:MAG: response regulator [Gemmatimonadota bacterium]
MKRLRALFVEDREDDVLLVRRELRAADFDVHAARVETAEDLRTALAEAEWDIIISDFSMPRFSGPAALDVLKESGLDIPFIMISGTVGEETAVAALKAGANDFLSKRNLRRFIPALERELREAQSRAERRLAEERLRESEAALAAVFGASPLPIVTIDLEERVTAWNPAAERVFGWRADEIIGHQPPFPIGADRNEVERARKDGSPIRVIVSASPLADRAGNVSGTVAIVTDVTEQRALEEQFRQAQKMEAVGQLAGGVAHDFNNILTAIQGYASLALGGLPKDSAHYEDIQEILNAADRAAGFTRQLLAFSRKQVTHPDLVGINELITNLRNLLGRVIGETYALQLELSADAGPIFADRGQLEQVVMNLVVNARDAMPGGGTILVRTERVEVRPEGVLYGEDTAAGGPYIVVRVRDTGHGMRPETVARIFEPFFTTKEPGKGTGLGLSTVYGIVVQNHGFLTVDTRLGEGTEFSIYLPEPGDAQRAAPDDPAVPEVAGREIFARILVVEDDAAVRRLLQRTLERAGFTVIAARDAAEAIELLSADPAPDMVITDMLLPGMTGAELLAAAREMVPQIKTMLISGYSSEDLALPPEHAFLEKPFTPDALIETVNALFARKPAAG